jgi:Ca-activated chloride channel family protein
VNQRGRIPYGLIAVVFGPALVAYLWFLRGLPNLSFAHPAALALIPLAVALVLYAGITRGAGRRAVLVHSRAGELAAASGGWSAGWRTCRWCCGCWWWCCWGWCWPGRAPAGPRTRSTSRASTSSSRWTCRGRWPRPICCPRASTPPRQVIRNFVRQRPTDRIGLVVFAKDAFTHVPLTLDHGTMLRMLGELQLELIDGKGTAIGNGLGVALTRLRRSDAKSKVIILLTDGDNNAGNITPMKAAGIAQQLGVKIYTVLAGDNASADERGGRRFPVNPKLLEEIATSTGGVPYLATDNQALSERFQDILGELQKSHIRERGVLYAELFPRFLYPALLVLLLEIVLTLTRFRRLP